jgi:hypothetical protein
VAAPRPPTSASAVVANMTCIDPSTINGPAFVYGSLVENNETTLRIHTPYLTDDAALNNGTYLFVIPAQPGETYWIDGPNDPGAPSPWPTAPGVTEPLYPGAYFQGTIAPPIACPGFGGFPPTPTASASAQASGLPASLRAMPTATAVTVARTLGDPHITLAPPGNIVPKISSDAAYELCLNGAAACFAEPPTTIELALVTDSAYGTTSSSGKLTLTLQNTLVWAISWIGSSQCQFVGGGPGPSPSTPAVQPLCDRVAFVNATTGQYIFSVSYAHQ